MPATDPLVEPATETAPHPARQPLRPAHPDAPAQPVLVADLLTGTPTWVYPPAATTPAPPRVDPLAQRILACGAAAPLIGVGANMVFGAMAGATTAIGYAAVCVVGAAALRRGGSAGNNVNIRIDNRGR
jgi:hypothetical protein